jgi:hypothetical protein
MASVSKHLQKLHGSAAAFHRSMAKCHGDALEFKKAAKEDEEGSPWATFHRSAMTAHSEAAGAHEAMCEECSKAAQAADLEKNELVPTRVSAVAPDRTTITPVVRTGAKPFPSQHPAVPIGGVDFSKIIGIRDEDLNEL